MKGMHAGCQVYVAIIVLDDVLQVAYPPLLRARGPEFADNGLHRPMEALDGALRLGAAGHASDVPHVLSAEQGLEFCRNKL